MPTIDPGGRMGSSTMSGALSSVGSSSQIDLDAVGHSEQIYNLVSVINSCDEKLLECGDLESLTRYSFCHPGGNAQPQLQLYQSWVVHILRLLGKEIEIRKDDDPMTITEAIVDALQGFDLCGIEVSVSSLRTLVKHRGLRLATYEPYSRKCLGDAHNPAEHVKDYAEAHKNDLGTHSGFFASDYEDDEDEPHRTELNEPKERELAASAVNKNSRSFAREQWKEEVEVSEHGEVLKELTNQAERRQQLVAQLEDLQTKRVATQEACDRSSKILQDKCNRATDTRPLQELAKMLTTLRGEIKQMELRNGVLQHINLRMLLQSALLSMQLNSGLVYYST
ncbi:hypothetical protein NCLIV_007920 [Neospora caninum Liverpool]|uniref:Uncharacterized protein n=1 Tax=Neospora caninum (strain Liverpool) TaxID=572307 RepID=F0V994_NEOCL|nr:hypothetical protein NCLIV_007920 [Neospora caninum Liverpool]CBZ50319.1 hypothetical protein NCLIV_007920 [Neospora caninum Liverpool]CEL64925.1 TPA: hypothetical protein BN1204_007920 [Neospora caninum Liverpool]|eukprot:XP_003880353.1 hypothetical protein NCLIV_007920 [Neospora caninum Liverpool]